MWEFVNGNDLTGQGLCVLRLEARAYSQPVFLVDKALLYPEEGTGLTRTFYNALLGEASKRLRRMRADPAWQAARALPRREKQK